MKRGRDVFIVLNGDYDVLNVFCNHKDALDSLHDSYESQEWKEQVIVNMRKYQEESDLDSVELEEAIKVIRGEPYDFKVMSGILGEIGGHTLIKKKLK